MRYSKEEKENLLNQLDKLLFGEKPVIFLKFTKKEQFAKDLINGEFYANTPTYFRKLEIETGERGQGDKQELLSVIKAKNLQFTGYANNNFDFFLPEAKVTLKFKEDDEIPMISFSALTIHDMIMVNADEKHAEFKLPYSDEELNLMSKTFGEYCVVFETGLLTKKLENYSLKNEIAYKLDKINYCDQLEKERLQAFAKCSEDRFFYKNEDLKYQREYRLVYDMKIPSDHKLRLGKFENNAIIIQSHELNKFSMTINYKLDIITS